MSQDDRRRIQVNPSDEEQAELEAIQEAFPFLRTFKRTALLVYLARRGMETLAGNPMLALTPAPTNTEMLALIAQAKARIRGSADPLEGAADRVQAEMDSDITPRSLNAVRAELERLRDSKKKRDESGGSGRKGPPPSKG